MNFQFVFDVFIRFALLTGRPCQKIQQMALERYAAVGHRAGPSRAAGVTIFKRENNSNSKLLNINKQAKIKTEKKI